MKRYILMFIICISLFMIYTNNVKAYTYQLNYIGNSNANITSGSNIVANNWTNFSPYTFRGWYRVQNEAIGITKGTFRINYTGFPGNLGTYNLLFMVFGDFGSDGYNESVDNWTWNANGSPCHTINSSKFTQYSGISTISCENMNVTNTNYLTLSFVVKNASSFGIANPILNNSTDFAMIENNMVTISSLLTSISNNTSNINALKSSMDAIVDKLNQQQQATEKINNNTNEIKNDIKDSSIDNNNATGTINNLSGQLASDNTITSLLLLPINFINVLIDGLSGECVPYSLGDLWGTEILLPCVNLYSTFGAIWYMVDTGLSALVIFKMSKYFIRLFNKLTNLKDGGLEEAYS